MLDSASVNSISSIPSANSQVESVPRAVDAPKALTHLQCTSEGKLSGGTWLFRVVVSVDRGFGGESADCDGA